jgi:hypothetical protein
VTTPVWLSEAPKSKVLMPNLPLTLQLFRNMLRTKTKLS